MDFNKANLRLLRNDIDAALQAVGKKHGLSLQAGSARFSLTTAEFKLQVAAVAANGTVLSRERQDFTAFASIVGLKPDWLDKSFTWNGKTFKVVGLNLKKRKQPVCCDSSDGKKYCFTATDVAQLLR